MRLNRVVGLQTLITSVVFVLLAFFTVIYWNRFESAHSKVESDAILLQDFRLIREATNSWMLNNDLVFASGQTYMVTGAIRQGEHILDLITSLSQELETEDFNSTLFEIVSHIQNNQNNLALVQQLDSNEIQAQLPTWDNLAQEVTTVFERLEELIGETIQASSQFADSSRRQFFAYLALACFIFAVTTFLSWRWLCRLIVQPLSELTEAAHDSLLHSTLMPVTSSRVVEIDALSRSINDFTESLAKRVDVRTKQLKEQHSQLLSEIELRNAAQKEAQDAAEAAIAASQAKNQFLANMSHEIRTPLNGIIGSIQILRNEKLGKNVETWIRTIEDSGNHLLSLVNAVLDFSKVDAGLSELDCEVFSSDELLRECRSIFTAQAKVKDIDFQFDIDPELPEQLVGDRLRIQQILTNLLGNAFKFTEMGHVVLRLVVDGFQEDTIRLVWEITDSGAGIPADKINTIFGSFEQVDNSTTRKYGGSGLGLTISRQLAQMMGGDITVDSELRVGSTFRCSMDLGYEKTSCLVDNASSTYVTIFSENKMLLTTLERNLKGIRYNICNSFEELTTKDGDKLLLVDQSAIESYMNLGHTNRLRIKSLLLAENDALLLNRKLTQEFSGKVAKPVIMRELISAICSQSVASAGTTQFELTDKNLRGHCLLVEDNTINQIITKSMLENAGLSVSIANHGEEALDQFQKESADIILMDCHMPIMDGITATMKIREYEKAHQMPSTPILALTANSQSEELQQCVSAGMNDYLTKPFHVNNLLNVLHKYLPAHSTGFEVDS